jgi:hypothetical protein
MTANLFPGQDPSQVTWFFVFLYYAYYYQSKSNQQMHRFIDKFILSPLHMSW